jgi:integrase
MSLTDLAIRQAKPRDKKYKLSAGGGLCLLVMPDGAKYWRLRYRYAGKQKELSLGKPYPETTLRDAQAEAARLRLTLTEGSDPAEKRIVDRLAKREAVAHNFDEAANAWHAHRARAWKLRTSEQVREYLDKDLLPKLGKRPLGAISARELADLIAGIEQRGAYDVAKKVRQWLRAIYSFARAKSWIDTAFDPARDLNALAAPAPAAQNFAHVTQAELPALLRKLDDYHGSPFVKACAWLSLWSANRPGVTRTLRWSELKLDEAVWVIEEGREGMKRGYFHVTPLPRQAVAMLRELHKLSGTFDYVFIGRNDPGKPLSDGAVAGMLKAIGYRGKQTAHGFRHVCSTALNELGYEADWVEKQLAHGDANKIRGTYNKASWLEPRRKMMQEWADHLDALKTGGNVVQLRRKSG